MSYQYVHTWLGCIKGKSEYLLRGMFCHGNDKSRGVGGWQSGKKARIYDEDIICAIDLGICINDRCSALEPTVSSEFGGTKPVV